MAAPPVQNMAFTDLTLAAERSGAALIVRFANEVELVC
jgi:hypothetical protein